MLKLIAYTVPWSAGTDLTRAPVAAFQIHTLLSPPAVETPVSRTAIFGVPLGVTEPKTLSQPICGSAHCEP